MKFCFALWAGYVLSLSFMIYLPHVYNHQHKLEAFYILVGFILQLIFEYFSGGIEHGHELHNEVALKKNSTIPFIALLVFTLLEGLVLGRCILHSNQLQIDSMNIQKLFGWGIILFQLPIIISMLRNKLFHLNKDKVQYIKTTLFLLMFPIGLCTGYLTINIGDVYLTIILINLIIGMFINNSTLILFEHSSNHKVNSFKLITVMTGVFFCLYLHNL